MSPVQSAEMSDDDIEHWLYLSGLMAPSVEALRPDFPRWRRYLRVLPSMRFGHRSPPIQLMLMPPTCFASSSGKPRWCGTLRLNTTCGTLGGVRPYKL